MNLLFPQFRQQRRHPLKQHTSNVVDVVSRTQLEYIIKQCNKYDRCLEVSYGKRANNTPLKSHIALDLSKMNDVLELDFNGKQITVQSGISISKLNKTLSENGLKLSCLPQIENSWEEATLN